MNKYRRSKTLVSCILVSLSALFVVSQACGQVQINPNLKLPNIAAIAKLPDASSMCESNGQIFGAGGGTINELDTKGVILSSVKIQVKQVGGISSFRNGLLLIGDTSNKMVLSVDPKSGQTVKLLLLRDTRTQGFPAGNLLTAGILSSVAFDGENVFVGITAGYSSSIFKINLQNNSLMAHAWAPGPNPSAMAFSGGNLFVLEGKRDAIRRYNGDLKQGSDVVKAPITGGRGLMVQQNAVSILAKLDQPVKTLNPSVISTLLKPELALNPRIRIDIGKINLQLPRQFAVLICGDIAEHGFSEFWSDTCWMYKTLRAAGYPAANIFVLYGNGSDYHSANPAYQSSEAITDFPSTNAWVDKVFDGLKLGDTANGIPQMNNRDSLFVWTFDHGAGSEPPVYLCLTDGWMIDTHFGLKINGISYAKRSIYMQQCFSGGYADELRNAKTFFSAAARGIEVAHEADTEKENVGGLWYPHGEYNYYITCALSGRDPSGGLINADTNGNGQVSSLEAHNWYASHENQPEIPVMDDSGGIGDAFNIH